MNILIVINDAPYGTEKAYNALRIAITLQKNHEECRVHIFLMADAVGCAVPNQKTPTGYYNIERMVKAVIQKEGLVKLCGGCSQVRGVAELRLIDGVELSNMNEFCEWVIQADQVLTF